MSQTCEFCWVPFKSEKCLKAHLQKIDNDCQNWKNIIFFCQNCNFVTKGYRNIKYHMKECKNDVTISNNPITKLNEKYKSIKNENKILTDKLKDLTDQKNKVEELERKLHIEKTKVKK